MWSRLSLVIAGRVAEDRSQCTEISRDATKPHDKANVGLLLHCILYIAYRFVTDGSSRVG